MLHSLTLIAALFIGSCAHDEADLSLAISNDLYNSMKNYKSLTVLGDSSLYDRPVGACTFNGSDALSDCHCSTEGEIVYIAYNGEEVVAFVCGPTCGRRILREADGVRILEEHHGGVCPTSSLGQTACRLGHHCVTPKPKCLPPMLAVTFKRYGTICMYKK